MNTEESRVVALASLLGIESITLSRHLVCPLMPPNITPVKGWNVPAICESIFEITGGFWLFSSMPESGFHFWGSSEYEDCIRFGGPIYGQANAHGLFPIFGDIPHLVSIVLSNGSVVATDWEVYGEREEGWGEVIAPDLQEYIRTLILVREAYGEFDQPSDWWYPYASHGGRYDLE